MTNLCEPCDSRGGHTAVLGIVRFVACCRITCRKIVRAVAIVIVIVIRGVWRAGRRKCGGDWRAIALLKS